MNLPGPLFGASLEGSMFEPSGKMFWKDLSHRFPAMHGEDIDTVKRGIRGYRAQPNATVASGV